jgi:uncharacterized protein YggE
MASMVLKQDGLHNIQRQGDLMRAFLVVLLLVPTLLCHAQLSSPNGVSVGGDAQVNVIPDRVTILLGVETRNKNLDEASSQNDSLIRQVLAAARKLEVNASDIQTDFIHVDLAYQNNDSTVVDYYKVTKEVQIVLKDVSKFESLVSAVLHSGANHIYGIDFNTSELRKYRDQARQVATKAAIDKANDIAAAAGMKVVGKPTSLATYSYGGGSSYRYCCGYSYGGNMAQNVVQNQVGAGDSGTESTVAPGKIAVYASVTMTFQMQ